MSDLYKQGSKHYFAASNTKDGFVSYFDNIFSDIDCDRVFILKGGPGCGKSTFMKKLGSLAEEMGLSAEYFHCSSDPMSLDGIIINEKRVCVIDGTSPHAAEPRLAGAREIIVDLGKSWDTDALFEKRNDIEKLSLQKKKYYNDAYSFLHTKSVMDSLIQNLVFPYILFDKLDKSAARLSKSLFKDIKEKTKADSRIRIASAFSSLGKIRFFTFEDSAEYCIFIKEPFSSCKLAHLFLSSVYEHAKSKNADVYISFNPEVKGQIDALYFPEIKVSVSLFDEDEVLKCDKIGKKCRIINCARFLDTKGMSDVNPLRKFYCRLSENMESKSLESLENAGKTHMETEKIYRTCTCYRTVEKIRDEYFKKILGS